MVTIYSEYEYIVKGLYFHYSLSVFVCVYVFVFVCVFVNLSVYQ